jgi:hypothetical protein
MADDFDIVTPIDITKMKQIIEDMRVDTEIRRREFAIRTYLNGLYDWEMY